MVMRRSDERETMVLAALILFLIVGTSIFLAHYERALDACKKSGKTHNFCFELMK